MAEGNGFVLVQWSDQGPGAFGQQDVPGGVGVSKAEFAQRPEEGAQDSAALVQGGGGGWADASVTGAAVGEDKVLGEIGGGVVEGERAAGLCVALVAPEELPEGSVGLGGHLSTGSHVGPEGDGLLEGVRQRHARG
ncbi:hypothetical protein [Actinacidiphila oryziradicis]|uniref:hypothetical protein n=1 Tax=Actinacidiphila oryziradicis TaxID=2571141 RepID=UPI0023F4AB7E|nr:hypothetical protein [Actinacidiphila oryziradicis]